MYKHFESQPTKRNNLFLATVCVMSLMGLIGCGGGSSLSGGPIQIQPAPPAFSGPLSAMSETVTFDSISATLSSCTAPVVCINSSSILARSSTHQIEIDPLADTVEITSGPGGTTNLTFNGVDFINGTSPRAVDTELEGVNVTERLTLLLPGAAASTLDWASYGVWSITTDIAPAGQQFVGGALSFGVLTPLTGKPVSGTATYSTGFMDGLYVNAAQLRFTLQGSASMTANFDTGEVLGTLSGIQATPIGGGAAVGFGDISLNANISGVNFSGAASSTGLVGVGPALNGTVQGSFYGPTAQEAGGAFRIENATGTDHAVGAFAVRQ